MALSRRGFRRIVVSNRELFWRLVDGADGGGRRDLRVDVVTEVAFMAGKRGQTLQWFLLRGRSITPRLVQWAIEAAVLREPPFTGADGVAGIVLSDADWWKIVGARLALLVESVSAALGAWPTEHLLELVSVGEYVVAVENLSSNLYECDDSVRHAARADLVALGTILGVDGCEMEDLPETLDG